MQPGDLEGYCQMPNLWTSSNVALSCCASIIIRASKIPHDVCYLMIQRIGEPQDRKREWGFEKRHGVHNRYSTKISRSINMPVSQLNYPFYLTTSPSDPDSTRVRLTYLVGGLLRITGLGFYHSIKGLKWGVEVKKGVGDDYE